MNSMNNNTISHSIITSTFLWCFLMPLIHIISLISNLLCMIVFCSNIFIKKPIAVYFICLLISDSITLLIGYIEMIDRELNMIDKSSLLCIFNEKVIHPISNIIYTFMGRFCLEWMLYKLLWTRVSTILLAILSIQRCRTFLSLSYRESRSCAILACIFSITMASIITCMEWTGVQYDQVDNPQIYYDILQSMIEKNNSKDFYFNQSNNSYSCLIDSLNITSTSYTINKTHCSSTTIALEYYSMTQSLLINRDPHIVETTTNFLIDSIHDHSNSNNHSLLKETIQIAKTSDILIRLFEKRSCSITLTYSIWLKFYEFFHSVSFGWNRHVMMIFFGNALPSFIVTSANLLSIKAIYFSKNLKYLKQSSRKNHRKRRLQNDMRAFLVIIIESISIILISWGIPIFLTMYYCRTLYVVNISYCPKIKDYLALFLCTDLFNSSTNCLLYSLSGKLFRRKFLHVIKSLLTCGHGTIWNRKQQLISSTHPPSDRQPSNSPLVNNKSAKHTRLKTRAYRLSEHISSPMNINSNRQINSSLESTIPSLYQHIDGQHRNISDENSISIRRGSNDQHGYPNSSSEIESDSTRRSTDIQLRKHSQSIRSYLIDKLRSFHSTNNTTNKRVSIDQPIPILVSNENFIKPKKNFLYSIFSKQQTRTALSLSSSSSFSVSAHQILQKPHSSIHRSSIPKIKYTNNSTVDNSSTIDNYIHENLTSL